MGKTIRMDNSSDNLRIWGVDAQTLAVWIIKFFSIIAIVLLLLTLARNFDSENSPSFWATFIGSCIAIAYALLLYATLRSQNESIVNTKEAHRQERFETTFFNLLDLQRRLTDEIVANYEDIDGQGNIHDKRAIGKEFFSFAKNEIKHISDSLESHISSLYDDRDIKIEWEELEKKLPGEDTNGELSKHGVNMLKDFRDRTRIRMCNRAYSISNEDRQQYSSNPNYAYTLFEKKWRPFYEQYINNLYCILQHTSEERYLTEGGTQKYINIVQAQMSRDELQLIEIHAQSCQVFRKMLDKTHITDIKTNNKI